MDKGIALFHSMINGSLGETKAIGRPDELITGLENTRHYLFQVSAPLQLVKDLFE
jgi:hypothetical protein